jgi:hypothetical protein
VSKGIRNISTATHADVVPGLDIRLASSFLCATELKSYEAGRIGYSCAFLHVPMRRAHLLRRVFKHGESVALQSHFLATAQHLQNR